MSEHTVRKEAGLVFITQECGPVLERQTLRCVHCGAHWVVEPGSGRQRGWCHNCAGPTCGGQECVVRCLPAEKMLEAIERQAAKANRGY